MSSSGFEPCREFELGRSTALCWAVAVLHALAFLCVAVAQVPWIARVAGWLVILWSAHRAWTRHATRSAPDAVVRITRRQDGRWRALRRDGVAVVGELDGDSFVHRRLVVVGIADGWRKVFVAVPWDVVDADTHRRLRVWVKWQPPVNRGAESAAPT